MKKIKSIVCILMMFMMVCTLTGCGDDKKDSKDSKKTSEDVLIATKSDNTSGLGDYKETIEITFKDGKADSVKEMMEFGDESTAKYAGSIMQMTASSLEGMNVEQEGNVITVKMEAETFLNGLGDNEDLSREAIEKNLQNSGFTIE